MSTYLRPIERRVQAMSQEGLDDAEIGRRIRKSPERVSAMRQWAEIPGRRMIPVHDGLLSPLQKRVVALREEGESHAEIGRRFRRGADYIRQVEGLARYRQSMDLLG